MLCLLSQVDLVTFFALDVAARPLSPWLEFKSSLFKVIANHLKTHFIQPFSNSTNKIINLKRRSVEDFVLKHFIDF